MNRLQKTDGRTQQNGLKWPLDKLQKTDGLTQQNGLN